jgi:antitoxin MazE
METRVKKWGNSQGIRLPKTILEEARLKSGDRVRLSVKDRSILISSTRSKLSLKQLIDRIAPGNLHSAVETGGPKGREVW